MNNRKVREGKVLSGKLQAHTPTPWKLVYEGNGEQCTPALITGEHLRISVDKAECFGSPLPDASFIVRACNSHEELLSIAKEYKTFLENRRIKTGSKNIYSEEIIKINKAIANAEAKQ